MSQLNVETDFQAAVVLHQAGRLPQAETLYRQILARQPKHFGALHYLGVIAHQQGHHGVAVDLICQALCLQPGRADAHNNLGVALKEKGQLDEAIVAYRQAIALKPHSPGAHYNLGAALKDKGHTAEAIEAYCQAITLRPAYPEAFNGLGVALADSGQLDGAIRAFRHAISLKPDLPKVHRNLGQALRDKSKLDETAPVLREASRPGSDSWAAGQNPSKTSRRMAQLDEAIAAQRRAIALKPDFPEAHANLSAALRDKGQFEEAIAACHQAISLKPDYPEAFNELGMVLGRKDQVDEAIAAYRQAIALKPHYAEAWANLGNALSVLKQFQQAIAVYRQAVVLRPEFAQARTHLAMSLLRQGEFLAGWEDYEWRLKDKGCATPRRHFSQPRWDGQPLKGRTLLLHAEQGYGDTLQFIRYVPLVAQRCSNLIVECPGTLQHLIQPITGGCPVVTAGHSLPSFDLECPLLSLPRIFRTTLESIPRDIPYLCPDADAAHAWKTRLAQAHPPSLNVGIAWAGNPTHRDDRNRSIALARLVPLGRVSGIRFVSLQKGESAAQAKNPPAGMERIEMSEDLKDFADTAALIANLDLVISVDTAVAHLAGAMGKPVWVLLPFVSDWRWLLDRDDSPWYPTMRLFRQPAKGDWESVMAKVADELSRWKPPGTEAVGT